MKPILYDPNESDFSHNGLGILNDCSSCYVTEEANGIFELEMEYAMDGIHFNEIQDRCIIKAKPNQYADPQLFRVYEIQKNGMGGIATVYAQHISYDLSGIPVSPFTAHGADGALSGLKSHSIIDNPFEFSTDKDVAAEFNVNIPASLRSRLAGNVGSVLDVFGGEFEFDNYKVILHKNRGRNRGLSIRYGKNLTDIEQERNCADVFTGVYPFWADTEYKNLVELPEKYIQADGQYNFQRIMVLDLSAEYVEGPPTEEQVRNRTLSYIKRNNIGVPKVSLTVEYAQIANAEEYKHLRLHEQVGLFDEVNVEFPAFGVSATAKAVKIVYNVLTDKVESVTLGSVRANIADTISAQESVISQTPTKSDVAKAQAAATAWLTNGLGYKVERRDSEGRVIDTLYLDIPNVDTAVNVLRIGQSGIGFSKNGVVGPYFNAWTIDGNLSASFITTGTLRSADGSVALDLDGAGSLRIVGPNGEQVARVSRSVDGTGGGFVAANSANTMEAAVRATNESAGFTISYGGSILAYLGVEASGNSVLKVKNISCENIWCSTINGNPV